MCPEICGAYFWPNLDLHLSLDFGFRLLSCFCELDCIIYLYSSYRKLFVSWPVFVLCFSFFFCFLCFVFLKPREFTVISFWQLAVPKWISWMRHLPLATWHSRLSETCGHNKSSEGDSHNLENYNYKVSIKLQFFAWLRLFLDSQSFFVNSFAVALCLWG